MYKIVLMICLGLSAGLAYAQDGQPAKPPPQAASAASPLMPPLAASIAAAAGGGSELDPVGSGDEKFRYYSGKFNLMVWICSVLVGGVGTFIVFLILHNHKRIRISGDQHWPILWTVTIPFLLLILPIAFPGNPVLSYDEWGSKCFDSETYGPERGVSAQADSLQSVKQKCVTAQNAPNSGGEGGDLSHSALGLNRVFDQYKRMFVNGTANAMYPGEMLLILWLMVSMIGLGIYEILLGIRRRFFVN